MKTIDFKVIEGHALLTLRGEGKFNPVSLRHFGEALDQCLAHTDRPKTLILTGSGRNFSQGLDLATLSVLDAASFHAFVDACMNMLGRLLVFPIPVVSAVNGHAFGFGAMLVLASDYAVMREDRGFFCLPEVDLGMGLIPSMNALVTRKLGRRAVRDLLLTGKRIDGREAVEYGAVDAHAGEQELLSCAMELPRPMMDKDKTALARLKTGINADILDHLASG